MIQRNQLKRSVLALAIAVATSGAVFAQSNSQGYIFGQVTGAGTVTVENLGTGQKRDVSVDADGNYRASALPTGKYKVTYNGQSREVTVSVGTGTPASFASADTTLGTVEVTGESVNPIDVSSVESSTVLTEAQIDAVPIARNVTAVALLAPGTVRGDSAFGNLASFGGSSVAENAYFINGFNVTNILTGTAFSQLPFEGIAEQQIKTGGYGAEFGRSMGGVINIQTKRGTNDWTFGANTYYSPSALRESSRVVIGANGESFDIDSVDTDDDALTFNLWGGGPIIEDRLFFFALLQSHKRDRSTFAATTSTRFEDDEPQGMLKLDWNISDNHLLELTAFRDKTSQDQIIFDSSVDYSETHDDLRGTALVETGGDNAVLKYTGYLTDSFTLSATAGHGEYKRFGASSADACPRVLDNRVPPTRVLGCWTSVTVQPGDAGDERDSIRVDAEWALADHSVRFGIDREEFATIDGLQYTGGQYFLYSRATPGARLANGAIVPDGVTQTVRRRVFQNGGSFLTKNNAWYVEDTWQATDNLMLYGGLRNEGFENLNSLGGSFIDITNTWAPRLGFSWDMNGDSTVKVFGNAGRYYIPVYANTNVRLAGAELDYQEFYTFTGIDPVTGAPSGLVQLGDRLTTTNGVVPDARAVVDNAIDPLFQDEFIVGFQTAIADNWSIGARAIHRKLGAGMDDICSGVFAEAWALENGYDADEAAAIAAGIDHCFLTNPGQDLDGNFHLDPDSDELTRIVIPASALGIPEATRKYNALEFFFERAWDDQWFIQGSWTIAHSYGNTEGYVKSDNGQDDAGITQDFDFPGLTEGAYGDLPNDRRHSLKVFGSYAFNDEWRMGANLLAQSGRPRNCFGYYSGTNDPAAVAYGAASFYCDRTDDGVESGELFGRGSFGRNPWVKQLDLQLAYNPAWAEGISLSMDVLNVFNSSNNFSSNEVGDSAPGVPDPSFLFPTQLQTGRSVRFGLQYDFK